MGIEALMRKAQKLLRRWFSRSVVEGRTETVILKKSSADIMDHVGNYNVIWDLVSPN